MIKAKLDYLVIILEKNFVKSKKNFFVYYNLHKLKEVIEKIQQKRNKEIKKELFYKYKILKCSLLFKKIKHGKMKFAFD